MPPAHRAFTGPAAPRSGETKLWDAQTGQELLLLPQGLSNLAFSADGRQLTATRKLTVLGVAFRTLGRLAAWPEVEAALLVEAVFSKPAGQRLPLKSEALAMVEADKLLTESARAAARQHVQRFAAMPRNSTRPPGKWPACRSSRERNTSGRWPMRWKGAKRIRSDLNIWNTRGVAHYRLGQYAAALAALNHSIELNSLPAPPIPKTWPSWP